MAKRKASELPEVSEKEIQRQCLEWLTWMNIPHWRSNTGAAKFGDHFVRFGVPGVSDIIAILPPTGRFCAIECKRRKGRLSEDQAAFLRSVEAAGGAAIVVRDVAELVGQINDLMRS